MKVKNGWPLHLRGEEKLAPSKRSAISGKATHTRAESLKLSEKYSYELMGAY